MYFYSTVDTIWYLFQVEVTYKGKVSVKAPVPGKNFM